MILNDEHTHTQHHAHTEACDGHEHKHGEACCHEQGHAHDGSCCHDHSDEACCHDHDEDGCCCGHAGELHIEKSEKRSIWQEHGDEIKPVLLGAALFAAAFAADKLVAARIPSLVLYIAAYVILGIAIYRNAGRHIRKGQIFDENLLMILASIGAFVIGEYPEAVAVILFYRVGELFEDIAVDRSRYQIGAVLDLRPDTVTLLEGGNAREIAAEEAKVGDVIQIKPGDRIPLDGVVAAGESQIDTSPLTGEPMPDAVSAGSTVLSGCVNQTGLLEIEVTHPLSESTVTRVLRSVEEATESKPHMERMITRFARVYTPIVVIVALLVFLIPVLLRQGDWHYWLKTACTFLVISCPCALVISVPLSFMTGIAAASKRGILFKSGEALEMIDRIKMYVVDKTGTLTNGKFGLQRVVAEGNVPAVEGETPEETILRLCASAEGKSSHPLAQSILRAADVWKLQPEEAAQVEELAGKGVRAVLKEGTVLCGSREYLQEQGIPVPGEPLQAYGTEVFVALEQTYLGRLLLADKIRADAKSFINAVHKTGSLLAILTGDKKINAQAVADYLGIKHVYAELLPDEKLDILRKLRKKHGRAMYVGDGINDAPVMAGADVSGAMAGGSDAAVEAADIVYMTSDLKAVEESIDIAYQTKRIAVENILLAMLIKLGVIFLGMMGYASMWMAILADTGVLILCVINAVRVLFFGKYRTTRRPELLIEEQRK